MNPNVDFYFNKAEKWQDELAQLRIIVLDSGLIETLKWGVPCYMLQENNIVLIHAFKEYCAVLFVKGALLKDINGILIQQTKNTQAARQMRFTNGQTIIEMKPTLKAYIEEAIDIEKAGFKVAFKEKTALIFPKEFQEKLDENPALKTAFEALTAGRQRAYNLYFAEPKQPKTRAARVEKCILQILNGQGLNEENKN
jgi:uncharacterized protein YdeI (YjbR/CyaY-like superfamily)